jgi:hypothetical protein
LRVKVYEGLLPKLQLHVYLSTHRATNCDSNKHSYNNTFKKTYQTTIFEAYIAYEPTVKATFKNTHSATIQFANKSN